jgi:mono/diheme cytochrome c family protein
MSKNRRSRLTLIAILLLAVVGSACRYDMQDQPRYKAYKKSDFFADKRSSRDFPEGTVPRGQLRENKAFYTGQKDNPDMSAPVESSVGQDGNTIVTSFPNAIDEFPMPVTKALLDRGQERYNIYCIVCHGPVGAGDGMIVRRGFSKPPTYHDDRLRNAPVGHLYDVITNGWGRMNGYAYPIQPADRWAIVAYIRALQVSQNPNSALNPAANTESPAAPPKEGATNGNVGGKP